MSVNVDPFVIPIPRKFSNDPELKPYFNYLHKFLHDIRNRTGGGDDAISNTVIREAYPWLEDYSDLDDKTGSLYGVSISDVDGLEAALLYAGQSQEIPSFRAVTVNENYTALPYDFINAKSRASIRFPAQPAENDVIIVRNGDGTLIDLDGNNKNINGSKKGYLKRKGTAIHFHYFIDTDEWFAR